MYTPITCASFNPASFAFQFMDAQQALAQLAVQGLLQLFYLGAGFPQLQG